MARYARTVKVPVTTLQDYAAKLQGFADDNSDIFDRVCNSLLSLEGSGEWKGDSVTAAINATKENKEKFSEAVSDLNDLAKYLKKFADEMSAKDEELKIRITSV